jgi:hypothetical protein
MGLISSGTTIFDNGAMASGFGGNMVLVSSATASASASIEFTLGDYKEYKFFFVNMHPQTAECRFQFNFSTDSGSNYNVTKTSTHFFARHYEDGSSAELSYRADDDLAQSTAYQNLTIGINNNNDDNECGYLHLFNPSSTTYVKHFIANVNMISSNPFMYQGFVAGYANTTSALTNIRFQMSSGNIDDGTILMYGIV